MESWKNWSGIQQCSPDRIAHPRDEAELGEIVAATQTGVRVVGAGHSFSALIPTDTVIVSLDQMTGIVDSDASTNQVTCWAGTPLRQLGPLLWELGLSLPVQGDVDPQTLGGAIGTGTHGTGRNHGAISTLVVGFRLLLADGSFIDCDAENNANVFNAGRVGLGTLGIMTQIRLQCEPAFHLQHKMWTIPRDEFRTRHNQLLDSHRHCEFFHFIHSDCVFAKTLEATTSSETQKPPTADDLSLRLLCEAARFWPAAGRMLQRTVLRYVPAESFSNRAYLVYPSERNLKFNEVEYAIPAKDFEACEQELLEMCRKNKINEGFPFEYRWVRADDIWLSPFYERDSAVISVHLMERHRERPFFLNYWSFSV
ncbi:MAG: D-arabinono-1,4-lactone oxidase, partial [Planctomycetota bacterium]